MELIRKILAYLNERQQKILAIFIQVLRVDFILKDSVKNE